MKRVRISNFVHTGEAILSAAKLVDLGSAAVRLQGFAEAHTDYAAAQAAVDVANARTEEVVDRDSAIHVQQSEAIERLARQLIVDGKPMAKPFEAYGGDTLAVINRMFVVDAAVEIRRITAAVRNDKSASKATRSAADVAEQAAQAVVAAFESLPQLEAALREARHVRDRLGDRWVEALGKLKIAVRYAESEGTSGLYYALFSGVARRSRKRAKTEAATTSVDPATKDEASIASADAATKETDAA